MSESIGVRLKRAREERRLTIAQAASATRIRSHYLEALERDDMSSVPSSAQARGFLRIYADFLSLDPDELAPRAWTPEPLPTTQVAVPPPDLSAASGQASASPAQSPSPNLLARLRHRLSPRAQDSAVRGPQDTEAEVSRSTAQTQVPPPEPFVPVRSREEFPEPGTPLPEEPGRGEIPTVRRSTRKKSASSRGTKSEAENFSSPDAGSGGTHLKPDEAGIEPDDLKKKSH
jgi:cytoskeletal protein RodZ